MSLQTFKTLRNSRIEISKGNVPTTHTIDELLGLAHKKKKDFRLGVYKDLDDFKASSTYHEPMLSDFVNLENRKMKKNDWFLETGILGLKIVEIFLNMTREQLETIALEFLIYEVIYSSCYSVKYKILD